MMDSNINYSRDISDSNSSDEESVWHNTSEMIPLTTIVNSHFLQSDQNLNTRHENNFNRRRRRLGNILNYFTIDHLQTLRNASRLGNRTRFRNISNNLDLESVDEIENKISQEEYIDFRLYPLNLDWKDVESESSIAYDVHHTYGKVGLFLYTSLKSHISMENLTINNFLLKIIDIFAIMFEQDTLIKEDIFKALPRLSIIREILYKNLTTGEDTIPLKIILDIYELYYKKFDYPLHQNYINEFIPTAILFYSNLKKCELRLISHNYHIEMKKIKLFDVVLFNRKQQYLTHYKKLKAELIHLKHGLHNNQFII